MHSAPVYHVQLRIRDDSTIDIHERHIKDLEQTTPALTEFWQEDQITPKPLPGTNLNDPKRWVTIITKKLGWVTLEITEGFDAQNEQSAHDRARLAFERHRYATLQPLKLKNIAAELRIVLVKIEEILNITDCGSGVKIHA